MSRELEPGYDPGEPQRQHQVADAVGRLPAARHQPRDHEAAATEHRASRSAARSANVTSLVRFTAATPTPNTVPAQPSPRIRPNSPALAARARRCQCNGRTAADSTRCRPGRTLPLPVVRFTRYPRAGCRSRMAPERSVSDAEFRRPSRFPY